MNYDRPIPTGSTGYYGLDSPPISVWHHCVRRNWRDYSTQSDLEAEFRHLVATWLSDVMDVSSLTEVISHPAYLRIIAFGRPVLPFIFRELERAPDHWFAALSAITNEDPVLPAQRGNIHEMQRVWLEWADKQGYA